VPKNVVSDEDLIEFQHGFILDIFLISVWKLLLMIFDYRMNDLKYFNFFHWVDTK
jgi:hypothetical protein